MSNDKLIIRLFAILAMVLAVAGCARMGNPDGGWYDDSPPRIIGTSPEDKGTNIKSNKITIHFDEYIKLEDATSKVVVSPPQLEVPDIKSAGKKIVVELKDTLKDSITYTIDFSDAISDNNEGNPLGNYTFSFSTGAQIDTFEVSGTVVDASNLEPIKSILVGLYSDLSDAVFTKSPVIRVSRTDSRGRFIIRGVAPGTYRVYAMQDVDGNYYYSQKSEMIAFSHETFEPSCGPDIRQDTIWRDSLRIDSIIRVGYTHFYPDDIVLRAFTAEQTDRYLLKSERQEPDRLSFYFTYGDTLLPRLRGLNFNSDSAFIVEPSEKNDTIIYWLRDTMLINTDSLNIEFQYRITDSTGVLITQTDTLTMEPKLSYERRMKLAEKEFKDWQKAEEKKKKRGEAYDSIMPPKPLEPEMKVSSSLDPDKNILITMPAPLSKCDTSAVHLYSKIDTLWYRSRIEMTHYKGRMRQYQLRAEWRPGVEYSLEIDSAAFVDIYGHVSNAIKKGLKVRGEDEYGTLMVNMSGIPDTSTVIVQLLDNSDKVVKESKVIDGTADFFYLLPGKFYLRAFVDVNGNGIWDTGDYYADRQAETVYYYNKAVEVRDKWDITISWNATATRADKQKPLEITKQKPEQEKKLKNRNADRAKSLGITYDPASIKK